MTCCNCTRSPMTGGRSAASSVRTEIEYRVASPCSRTIISSMTSFTSTNSNCGVPFWKSRRIRLMISAARVPSFTILVAAARALSRFGTSRRQPVQATIGAGDRSGNRLIHFMRQGGSQLSHGGHPADACQIRLHLSQCLASSPRLFSLMSIALPTNCTKFPIRSKRDGRSCGCI